MRWPEKKDVFQKFFYDVGKHPTVSVKTSKSTTFVYSKAFEVHRTKTTAMIFKNWHEPTTRTILDFPIMYASFNPQISQFFVIIYIWI